MLRQVYDKGPSPYKSLVTAFRTIAKDEGARALYQVTLLYTSRVVPFNFY